MIAVTWSTMSRALPDLDGCQGRLRAEILQYLGTVIGANLRRGDKMFSFSGKKRRSTKLCRDLVNFFHGQKTFISDFWLEDKDGHPNGAALGYMFGFVDRALHAAALDIRDTDGRAMMLALLNEFAPGRASSYYDFLVRANGHTSVIIGIALGGNEHRDWTNSKGKFVAVRWATCFRRIEVVDKGRAETQHAQRLLETNAAKATNRNREHHALKGGKLEGVTIPGEEKRG